MTRFCCICLSPAVDATVRLAAWPSDGCIIKNAVDELHPGGKAVNVARYLAVRHGATVSCGGLLGEDNAALFARELAACRVEDRFVRVSGATRLNEMFVTPSGSFKVNRAAFAGLSRDSVFSRVVETMKGADVVVLSGSLPSGWPADTYRLMVEAAHAYDANVVLDASGAALVEGVKARPDVIKPNADECAALVGFVPKTPDDFRRATERLHRVANFPIISDGAAGCWFDGAFVAAPEVDVLDTTAAGDTLLSEWCARFYAKRDPDAELWAVAAGSAACTMPGGEPPAPELVERLFLAGRASRRA